jgi:hypothetical protein
MIRYSKSLLALVAVTVIIISLCGCNTQSVSTSSGHSNDPPLIKTPVGMFCFGGIPTAVDGDKRTAEMEAQQLNKLAQASNPKTSR